MVMVKAQPGQSSDSIIRAFQKKVLSENILDELEKRRFFQKPSLKRKIAMQARRQGRWGSR